MHESSTMTLQGRLVVTSAHSFVVTLTAALLLSGCSLVQGTMPASTMSNPEILGLLTTIHSGEIEAGQLAKQAASAPQVRAFASRMVSEHQTMKQNIDGLAKDLHVQPYKPALASTIEGIHQKTMEQLRTKSGSDFDKTYMAYEVKMHEHAVALVRKTKDSVANQEIQEELRNVRPHLQNHLAAAEYIEHEIGSQQ